MGVKHSFKQILVLMASKRAYCRVLSVVLMVVMTLQLAVVPASAALWFKQDQEDPVAEGTEEGGVTAPEQELRPTEPTLKNTFALVVATGGQSGESIQYFKVIYEDTNGIRRAEYIFRNDNKDSFELAQKYGNADDRRTRANDRFSIKFGSSQIGNSTCVNAMQAEKKDT